NAGENFYAKMMRIEDIIIDPDIARLFKMSDNTREIIAQDIKEQGFDKGQPLSLWKGKNIVLDGHTRLAAAREAGLEEIPVVEREFENKEDAILYTFERQVIRRNLTADEIITAVELMPETRSRKGQGRTAAQLAERLKVSEAHIYQIRAILKKAAPEEIDAVRTGKTSVMETYLKINPPKPRERDTEPYVAVHDSILVSRLDILKSAVVLLAGAAETKAALLLVNHFFRKNERKAFIKVLPENIKRFLEEIQPV
ncbi:MAG: ParB N-terminal domain-containing protein, partial [Treponema sp.]|nr:ParB N-terminal domain-containing protein [Treponema sp.]